MLTLLLIALSGDVPEPKMVECLLNSGEDPNFKLLEVGLQTPWTVALTKVTILYTLQSQLGSSAEYSRAEDKWKQALRLMFSKVPDYMTVPEPLLTPISRRLLQELRDEAKSSRSIWLRMWNWGGVKLQGKPTQGENDIFKLWSPLAQSDYREGSEPSKLQSC